MQQVLADPVAAGVPVAAQAVWQLQRGWTSLRDQGEIARILCAFTGRDLLELKSTLCSRPDKHDLEELVFRDVGNRRLRERILAHIDEQARLTPVPDVKVLCDVDDTVTSSLHDDRFPSGTVYPGVLSLLEAIDLGTARRPSTIGDLTFLSARPRDAWGLIENQSMATLRRAGVKRSSMLTGTFWGLRSHRGMARGKLDNLRRYRRLFPEYGLVFFGDSGQGDLEVAQTMLTEHPDCVHGVFIHDVTGMSADDRESLGRDGIHVFDSYIGAAGHARDLELIDARALQAVGEQAWQALTSVPFTSDDQRETALACARRDLARYGLHAPS